MFRWIAWPGRAKSVSSEPTAQVKRLLGVIAALYPGVQEPIREWQFLHPHREWAFDLAWPFARGIMNGLAIEVDGGVFSMGRHVRGAGYAEDCIKLAAAQAVGWTVVRIPAVWLNQDPRHADWNKVLVVLRAGVHAVEQRMTVPFIPEWVGDFVNVKAKVRKSRVVREVHRG